MGGGGYQIADKIIEHFARSKYGANSFQYPPREGTPEVAGTVPSLFLLSAAWVGRSPPLLPKGAGGLYPPRVGTPCENKH